MDPKVVQDCFANLNKLEWSDESLTLLQLIESLEMPQMVRVKRSLTQDIRQDDHLLLQSVYDRYVLLAHQLDNNGNQREPTYLIPDWYRAQCRVVSQSPQIQRQFWNFQGAAEINRFDLPREINFLVETPLYQYSQKVGNKTEWKRVCLKRNTRLIASHLHQYSINGVAQGACFILNDKTGNQYLLPSTYNIKFSVQIQSDEYNSSYFDHKKVFTLPEVVTRYELPVNVEFTQSNDMVNTIPQSKLPQGPVKITAVAIAKSMVGVLLNSQTRQHSFVELSPATPVDLAIAKCLQKGLKNPDATLTAQEEAQYSLYNDTREKILNSYNKACELYKYDLRPASNEEKEAMFKIYDAGKRYKLEEAKIISDNYLLNLNSSERQNPDAKIPFLNLKTMFLRPNIDEGDPYDDVNHEQEGEESEEYGPTHDISALQQMPDRIMTDIAAEMENLRI